MMESPPHLAPDEFDELVSEVIESLPGEWSPVFDQVTVVVEDEPGDEDLGIDDLDLEAGVLEDEDEEGADEPEQLPFGRFRGFAQPVRLLGGLTGTPPVSPPELACSRGRWSGQAARWTSCGRTYGRLLSRRSVTSSA